MAVRRTGVHEGPSSPSRLVVNNPSPEDLCLEDDVEGSIWDIATVTVLATCPAALTSRTVVDLSQMTSTSPSDPVVPNWDPVESTQPRRRVP